MFARSSRQPLGQHFLKAKDPAGSFVDLVTAPAGATILEIGPGRGALTRCLLDREFTLVTIERDEHLAASLASEGIPVLTGDALNTPTDLPTFIEEREISWVVGNLPYYAATAILLRYLPVLGHLEGLLFTFQEEVAQRIAAREGGSSYGSLSVIARTYSVPEICLILPPEVFSPPPKVSSAVVRFRPRNEGNIPPFEPFAAFVRSCFAHPRKKLSNNLKEKDLTGIVNGDLRPGALSPEDYVDLFTALTGRGDS